MPSVSNVCVFFFLPFCAKETYIGIYIIVDDVYEQYTIVPQGMKMKLHQDVCRYAIILCCFIEKLKRV